ncbi:MAG: transglutaminase family protein [Acidimicrobiales bacterium]
MRITISHTTTYRYGSPVRYGLQELRLHPRNEPTQHVVRWSTSVAGGTHELFFDDHYGNRVELVSIDAGASETIVTARGEVETLDTSGIAARHFGHTPLWFYLRATPRTMPGKGVQRIADAVRDEADDVTRLHALSAAIRDAVVYQPGGSHVASTAEDVLDAGSGVCQDHAHVFIAAARVLGYSARYVSGYLLMDDTVEQDATHAWAEVWIDGLGWVGFDVSNGISPDDRYVRIATGLEYRAAAPISGVTYGAGEESLEVALQVQQGRGGQQ